MEYVIILLFWLAFAGGVGALASSRGRSGAGWFVIALACSPVLGAFMLLVSPDLKQQAANTQFGVAQMWRQQEFQRAQAAEHYRLAQAEAARANAEQARVTGPEFAVALEKLRRLYEKGLLTEVEYTARKRENIDDLMRRTIVGSREDFLAELLPLIDVGGLTPEDIVRVKAAVLEGQASRPGAVALAPGPRGPHPALLASPPWPQAPQAAPTAAAAAATYRAAPARVQRPTGLALLALAVPLVLFVLHVVVFGLAGAIPLAILLAAGTVSASAISLSSAARGMTSRELWNRLIRKRAIPYAAAGTVTVAEIAALYVGISVHRWRSKFDATLASPDPCAVLAVTNTDHATEEQLEQRSAREEECREQRAREAKEARHKQCLDAAGALAAGRPLAPYLELLQSFGDTAERMLSHKITPADLADTSKATMPCDEFPDAVAAFYLAYAKIAVQVPSAWADVTTSSAVDQDLRRLLEDREVKLSSETDKVLATVVTDVATAAARTGKTTDDMSNAHELCEMQKSIGATQSDACAYLKARYQAAKKVEDAKAAARQRAADAKEKRQEAIEDAKDKRFSACTDACDRLPDGPAQDACSDRCLGFKGSLFP